MLTALSLFLLFPTTPACAQYGSKDYFPLADGAKWDYSGYLYADGHQYDFRGNFHVDGQTLIRGQRYYKLVISSSLSGFPGAPKSMSEVRYYRATPDAIYVLPSGDTNQPELLEMPLPVSAGVSWLSGTSEARAERAGTVSAGGRAYTDCLKITYKSADGSTSTENYLAPGVGIVKAVYVNNNPPQTTVELILDKYTL